MMRSNTFFPKPHYKIPRRPETPIKRQIEADFKKNRNKCKYNAGQHRQRSRTVSTAGENADASLQWNPPAIAKSYLKLHLPNRKSELEDKSNQT